jgi:GNAT superfamily N-acetyltransferase
MTAVSQGVQLRFARPDDTAAIGAFLTELGGEYFDERFPGASAADFYRWKYYSSPYGTAVVCLAVTGDDRIAGVVCATPKRMWVQGRTRRVFEFGDFLVAPDFRGRGLFGDLIEMAAGECARRGGELAYVRPNQLSFRLLIRRGFQQVQQVKERRYPVPSRAIGRRLPGAGPLARALGADALMRRKLPRTASGAPVLERVTSFGPETAELWERAAPGYGVCVARTVEYLNWRYRDSPTPFELWIARRGPDPSGLAVTFLSPGQQVGFLADAFTAADDSGAADAIVRHTLLDLLARGARSVICATPLHGPRCALRTVLERACLRAPEASAAVVVRELGGRWEEPQGAWLLSLGDFDGV